MTQNNIAYLNHYQKQAEVVPPFIERSLPQQPRLPDLVKIREKNMTPICAFSQQENGIAKVKEMKSLMVIM